MREIPETAINPEAGFSLSAQADPEACFAMPARELIPAAVDLLTRRVAEHEVAWGLGSESSYEVDLKKGELVWNFEDRLEKVTAPFQFIGSLNPLDGSFMWGRENPSVPEFLRSAAGRVHAWGEAQGVTALQKSRIEGCSEETAWRFVALAMALSGAEGGYCAVSPGPLVYLTFGPVRREILEAPEEAGGNAAEEGAAPDVTEPNPKL